MEGLKNISDVEKLKILKALRIGCATEEEFFKYIEQFSGTQDPAEIRRRLDGYFLEDEFALFCFLNQCCSSVTPLGQSPVGNASLKIPDYLITFKTPLGEYPCFVEVKTTVNYETKKLSKNMLDSYKKFSEKFKLPLFFASRIQLGANGLWIMQSADEYESNGRLANIDLYTKTSGFALLNDYAISIITPFRLERQYSDSPSESKIYHEGLGYLHGTVVSTDVGSPLCCLREVQPPSEISFTRFAFVNAIFDQFGGEEVVKRCEHGVAVTRTFSLMSSVFLSCLIVSINKMISNSDGIADNINASRFLARIENGDNAYINRQKLLTMIDGINEIAQEVISQPLLGYGEFGEIGDRKKHLEALFI